MGLTVLDAGVVIAILDRLDVHHRPARDAVAAARDRGSHFVVPASAYAEILVAPLRRDDGSDLAVDEFLDALPAEVSPATRTVARRAAELRARHGAALRLPDALVIATALALAADDVVTTDGQWPEIGVPVTLVGGSLDRT